MNTAERVVSERDRQVRRVILIEGGANAIIVVTKLIVGVLTGSLAIVGDAIHSLTDLLNNVVTWLVMRVSESPADSNHPYGHRKFESLAVFGLAMLLVVLAFELLLAALRRDATDVASGPVALSIMIATLAVNIGIAWWQRRWAKRLDADILHADATHTFSDVLTTVAVIAGWQLSARGLPWLDTVTAVAVAGIVLWLAYGLFRRAVPILVDESGVDEQQIRAALAELDEGIVVTRARSRRTGGRLAARRRRPSPRPTGSGVAPSSCSSSASAPRTSSSRSRRGAAPTSAGRPAPPRSRRAVAD